MPWVVRGSSPALRDFAQSGQATRTDSACIDPVGLRRVLEGGVIPLPRAGAKSNMRVSERQKVYLIGSDRSGVRQA